MTRTRLVVYLSLFMAMAGFGITVPVLPFMARQLGASPVGVALLVSLFALAQFLSGPVWGSLSDRYGRKKVLVAGLLGYALSFFLAGRSHSVPALVGSRALGGLLSASIFPSSQALVADVTPPQDRGPAMAALGAWTNLGFLFGPAMGGSLSRFGYAVPLYVAGLVVVVTAGLAATGLREPDGAQPTTAARAWPRPADLVLAARSPIAPYLVLTFATAFSGSGLTALLAYFVIDRFGGTSLDAGAIFAALGLTGVAVQGFLVGRLMRRFGEHSLALVGAAVSAVGFLALVPAASLPAAFAATVVIGTGTSVLRPSLTSAVSCLTPLPQGLTMGTQSSLDALGRMSGPLVDGWVYGYGVALPFWSSAVVMAASGTAAGLWTRQGAGWAEGTPVAASQARRAAGPLDEATGQGTDRIDA